MDTKEKKLMKKDKMIVEEVVKNIALKEFKEIYKNDQKKRKKFILSWKNFSIILLNFM